MAHLLGPSGAARFLQTGEVSQAAADANGGVENLKRIAQGRLAGGPAPSSGAAPLVPQAQPGEGVAVATGQGVQGTQTMNAPVNPEAPMPANQGIKIPGLPTMSQMAQQPAQTPTSALTPLQNGIQKFQDNQDNLDELVRMRNDQSIPEHLRQRAGTRAYELMNSQYQEQKAKDRAQELIANGDQMALARAMTGKPRDEEGSWLKFLLLGFVSPQLAGAEAIKLGIAPTKWEGAVITDKDGNDIGVEVQRRADGKILGGTRSDGTKLTTDELNQVTGIAQNLKTLATQANQSATHSMDAMRKENQLAINAKLPPPYTEDQIMARGKEVYRQTMAVSRAAPAGGNRPAAAATTTEAATTTTPTAKAGVLENWTAQRPGEDVKAYAKRQQIRPEDVESAAQQLAEGRIKPSDLGYKPEFRNIAVQRAEEISGKTYSPMRYDQVKKVVERYTSGEDHKTLVNIGTAANHLLAFRDAAMSVPEGQRTDVSAWNSFAQKYSKFINAPEVKNKEAMAEFVAGEMVKAATGTGGGVAERLALEKKLLAANTPAEWNAVINGQLELAHGRYGELKSSYERSTGRKDFDTTVGIGGEAAKEFGKIEAVKAAKTGSYSDAEKEARYQEWKRKQGTK